MNANFNPMIKPDLPGVVYRGYRGEEDFPVMVQIWNQMRAADLTEGSFTLEDAEINFRHLYNCDPFRDMIFAEMDGVPAAYGRVMWLQEGPRKAFYQIFNMNPALQGSGIDIPMQTWMEQRQLEIAADLADEGEKVFIQCSASEDTHRMGLLESFGYKAVRWYFSMSRDLNELPDVDLPEGIEVRPAFPSEYRKVYDRSNEAFSEHWGFVEPREEDYQTWKDGRWFQPMLWQVAWDGDEPVGQVENYIDALENEKLGRLRGYTEGISVLKAYRGKGIARALIARSLRMLKAMNLEEAALSVDSDNACGALRLYENMGYRTYQTMVEWRKPMPELQLESR
ncbi:MAG TPA: GNAT family N-acetyltransferase [Anaerolineaceae bacterium]|nr:GNAT family N-acetyltransferase [Anaerolineaceae bacterium]HPS33143.1 GNAT family N-acetyltransferase [Anaerolineaceae bacterium]